MPILSSLKQSLMQILPPGVIHRMKKFHYPSKLKNATLDVEPELRIIAALVAEDDRVLDVGANIGLYTRFLSEMVGAEGRVTSMEPVPETFDLLSNNVRCLGLANVDLVNAAVSDTEGSVEMAVPDFRDGGRNYYMAHIVDEGQEGEEGYSVTVQTVTLDGVAGPEQKPVTFVKCDVEGHELSCVRGAVGVTERFLPAWLVEIDGNPADESTDAHATVAFFLERQYRVYTPADGGLVAWHPGSRAVNYFMLQDGHVDALTAAGIPVR